MQTQSLPVSSIEYFDIKIGNESLSIRPWKTRDEKNYLIKKEQKASTNQDITDEDLFEVLMKPCIKDADKYNFTDKQKQYLFVKIREISLGSDIIINFTCTECHNYQEIDLSLKDIVKYKPEDYKDISLKHNSNGNDKEYLFKFKKNNSSSFKSRIDSLDTAVEKDFASLCLSIYEVQETVKGNTDTYNSFSYDELSNYIEDLPTEIFNELFDKYYNMLDEITFKYKAKCQVCGHVNEDDLDNIPNFLWD